jgi:hypothetical protein
MIRSFNNFEKYVKDVDIYEDINMKNYHFNDNIDTIMVNAGMGMGKTKKLHNLFNYYENKKIVIVSFRRTLDAEYVNNFEGFELYQNIKGTYDTNLYSKMVIQIDSFYKIMGEIDLLVLDEFTYTAMHLIERAKNKEYNYNALFEYILNKNTKIIVMDALMDEYCIKWFFYQNRSIQYIENKYKKHSNIRVINYSNKIGLFIKDLLENLKNGKKLIVPTNSKSFLTNLKKEIDTNLPNIKYKFLNADNSDDINLDIWDNYDIIGYTPTIVAGVSYEKKYFDKVFGYFVNSSSSAEMSLQQLFRVRDIKNNEINLCIENKDNNKYLTQRKDIKNYIIEKNTCLIDGYMNVKISRINRNIIEDSYFYLYLDCQLKKFKSKNNYENILLELLKKQGINSIEYINENDLNLDKKARSSMRETSKITNEEIINDVINSEEIDNDQYNIMKNKINLTYKDKCILKKKKFRMVYKYDGPINFDIYKKFSKKYEQFKNLNMCFTLKDNLIKYLKNKTQIIEDTKLDKTEKVINETLNDYGKKLLSANPFVLHQSKKNEKIIIGLDILRILGIHNIFDNNKFKIDFKILLEYIKNNEKIIRLLFNCKQFDFNIKNDEKGNNEILKYINARLRTLFNLQIKKIDKISNDYIINGMDYWTEELSPFREDDELLIEMYINTMLEKDIDEF